jgi:hypothetical protein
MESLCFHPENEDGGELSTQPQLSNQTPLAGKMVTKDSP